MREAMFDLHAPGTNLPNTQCTIYQEIAKIASVMRNTEALRFGRMYFRQISGHGVNFGLPFGHEFTPAFSRILLPREVLVAYNVSDRRRQDHVVVAAESHAAGDRLKVLYGGPAGHPDVVVQRNADDTHHVQLNLAPRQFVILS